MGPALAREVLERMRAGRSAPPTPGDRGGFPARFDLALAEPRPAAARAADESVAQVLLAEDDPVNRMVAQHQLRSLGYRVTVVENGREVLAALEQGGVDAVLMDCQMPELDGWEATREIRRRERAGEHLPIIAVTAHALEGDRQRCLEAGMDDYVAKPYREKMLGAVLERWLGRRENEP
jgi:CheY-like chemotaxis protein